jgi:hypothetical protein
VAVRAAGVNPVDVGNRADWTWAGLTAPCILGYDIAGVVESTGPEVSGLAPGNRVLAMTHFRDGAGALVLTILPPGRSAKTSRWYRSGPRRRMRVARNEHEGAVRREHVEWGLPAGDR